MPLNSEPPARADVWGEFREPNIITVSSTQHGHLFSVIETLANEVIHLKQFLDKTDNKNQHNAEFKRLAKRVCSTMGWDEKRF
jgi:thiamine monophosphate synthase